MKTVTSELEEELRRLERQIEEEVKETKHIKIWSDLKMRKDEEKYLEKCKRLTLKNAAYNHK